MPFCSFGENAAMFDMTPIDNMFLLEYMPGAPRDYVCVYLYARMLCLHPEHFLLHLLRLLHHSRLIHSAGHTPESAFCHNMILLS